MSQVLQDYEKTYISTQTTTSVFTGPGTLVAIVVGTTANGAIDIVDNTAGTTANVGSLKANIVEDTYTFNCAIKLGLRIVTAAASKITVIWKQS